MQSHNKTRLIHLVRNYYPRSGGNQNQCRLLTEMLANMAYEVSILTERYTTEIPKREIVNKVTVYRLASLNTYKSNLAKFKLLRKLVTLNSFIYKNCNRIWNYLSEYFFLLNVSFTLIKSKRNFDLLHIHQSNSIAFWGLVAAKLVKKKALIKDATLGGFDELKYMPFRKPIKRYLVKNGTFVAISSLIRDDLINQGVSQDRIITIPNGTNLPSQVNMHDASNNDILFVGNFWQGKIKGLDILIEAMVEVSAIIENSKLLILGEGNCDEYLDFIARNNLTNSIQFLGKQTTSSFYEKSFIFVLPSRKEGMSNALLEAMAFAMPCISTKVSGSTDLIQNGVNGVLIDVENTGQLAQAIINLFKNRNKAYELGNKAGITIEQNYSISSISDQYETAYIKMLSR
jgi:glycosyltransferase involved in cell wall biosynthesis